MDRRDAEPALPGPREPTGDSVETILKLSIDLYGPSLLGQPDKLKRQLEERCPGAAFDISLLLMALDEEIPQSLLRAASPDEVRRLLPRLETQLTERRDLVPFAAAWAVATWADVLRMDSAPLASSAALPTALPTTLPTPLPDKPSAPLAAGEPAIETVPAVLEPVAEPIAVRSVGVAEAREVEREREVEVGRGSGLRDERANEPASEPANEPFVDPEAVAALIGASEPAGAATAAAVIAPELDAAARPPSPPTVPMVPMLATPPLAPEAGLPSWAAGAEPVDDESYPAPVREFNRWYGIGGVLLALLVFVVSIRYASTSGDTPPVSSASAPSPATTTSPAPAVVAPAVVASSPADPTATAPTAVTATAPVPAPSPATASATAPVPAPASLAATPPMPRIAAVTTDDPLPGDGSEHPVFVAVDAMRDDVRRVETQFVGGDGTWDARPRVVDVRGDTSADGRIAAGTIGLRTTHPATATFRYVLTMADGTHSAPFVKQFTFTPVAMRPPTIVAITAPSGVTAGKPATLTIAFRDGDGDVATIERRTVGGDSGPSGGAAVVTAVSSLAKSEAGTLRYPVDTSRTTARTAYELTLVDRDGLRSEPRRVVVEAALPVVAKPAPTAAAIIRPKPSIAAAAPPASAVASAASTTRAASAKPVATTAAPPGACTRATCGSVVSVREATTDGSAAKRRAGNNEVIVRMDDRSIHSLTLPGAWKTGQRVRLVGGKLAALDGRVANGEVVRAPPRVAPREPAAPPRRLLPESVPIVDQ